MSTTSSLLSSASATASAAAQSAAATQPASFKVIGVALAAGSGLLIGTSFVFKKKGLLSAQAKAGSMAGDGHEYLKSPMWWLGMSMMIVGEIFNFVAYAFAPAILVTPLGALSVVVCAILSSIFLKERLTLFGKLGCGLCILGATVVALNGPQEQSVTTILAFQALFLSPGFLVFGSIVILASIGLIFFVAPKYGDKNLLVYITVCSLIGGLSVACTSGLGASILTSIRGDNQFTHWFIYFLLGFVIITLLTEINYLNKALALFNTSMVTPVYYTTFTAATLITSVVLFQGFDASATGIVTVVCGFITIVVGITLLQLSKVDPAQLGSKLDRRSTILLAAARSEVHQDGDEEKNLECEEPGMDSLRGTFGAVGSIHRAMSARRSMRRRGSFDPSEALRRRAGTGTSLATLPTLKEDGVMRHSLYDNPMPRDDEDTGKQHDRDLSLPQFSTLEARTGRPRAESSLKFAEDDTLHLYAPKIGAGGAVHQSQRSPYSPTTPIAPTFPPPHANYYNRDNKETVLDSFGEATHYLDPYEDDEKARSQTLPRLKTSSHGLAASLSQHFASSTPSLPPPSSSPSDVISPSSKSRFGIPHFSPRRDASGSSGDNHHRVPHPAGPKDMDEAETVRLVRSSSDSEEEGGGKFGYRETGESRIL